MDHIRSLFLVYVSTNPSPSVAGFTAAARDEGFTASFTALFLDVIAEAYPKLFRCLS